jgi:ABC-2 type transport system permease protein
MAVYKRDYQGYSGRMTPSWSRFLIPARHAFRSIFQSRLLTAYVAGCLLFPAGCAIYIYVCHNARLLELVGTPPAYAARLVNSTFFFYFLQVETVLAFVLVAFVGPGLVSPDLANQGIALYLSRPFSRLEYILGKMSVLAVLLSAITWIPGLILFAIQADLAGNGWTWENAWIAGGILLGSIVTILVFSLLALAFSAWFKRKWTAGGALFAVFFFGQGFAQALDAALGTRKGILVDLAKLLTTVENQLFRRPSSAGLSSAACWIELLVICALCLLLMARKVRAYEVVRS